MCEGLDVGAELGALEIDWLMADASKLVGEDWIRIVDILPPVFWRDVFEWLKTMPRVSFHAPSAGIDDNREMRTRSLKRRNTRRKKRDCQRMSSRGEKLRGCGTSCTKVRNKVDKW